MNIDSIPQGNQIAKESIKVNTQKLAVDEVKKTAKNDDEDKKN